MDDPCGVAVLETFEKLLCEVFDDGLCEGGPVLADEDGEVEVHVLEHDVECVGWWRIVVVVVFVFVFI